MMELKYDATKFMKVNFGALNRTMMELKFSKIKKKEKAQITLNRTMMELKLNIVVSFFNFLVPLIVP